MSKRARDRIVAVASELVAEVGWTGLTMARIADRAGVSRQTVYNAVESRNKLADLIVRRELEGFLKRVEVAVEPYADDLGATLERAIYKALSEPPDLRLLGSLATTWGSSPEECIRILLANQAALLERARRMVERQLRHFGLSATEDVQRAVADLLVRTTLTHALVPSEPPEEVAATLAWVAGQALGLDVPAPRSAAKPQPSTRSPKARKSTS